MKLKILSYNIHKGFTLSGNNYVLSQIKDALEATQCDIAFLQEVCSHDPSDILSSKSQFEYLADNVWSHFAYGRNSVYSGGSHGNAILSKFPIQHWWNLELKPRRIESRGLLAARIKLNDLDVPITCVCTHLSLFERSRSAQRQQLVDRLLKEAPLSDPLILAGDFNDWRMQACEDLFQKLNLADCYLQSHGRYAKTFPAALPLLPLDRIYLRAGKVVSAEVLKLDKLSDHCAVQCIIEL